LSRDVAVPAYADHLLGAAAGAFFFARAGLPLAMIRRFVDSACRALAWRGGGPELVYRTARSEIHGTTPPAILRVRRRTRGLLEGGGAAPRRSVRALEADPRPRTGSGRGPVRAPVAGCAPHRRRGSVPRGGPRDAGARRRRGRGRPESGPAAGIVPPPRPRRGVRVGSRDRGPPGGVSGGASDGRSAREQSGR